jgi:hypothetical protein
MIHGYRRAPTGHGHGHGHGHGTFIWPNQIKNFALMLIIMMNVVWHICHVSDHF